MYFYMIANEGVGRLAIEGENVEDNARSLRGTLVCRTTSLAIDIAGSIGLVSRKNGVYD